MAFPGLHRFRCIIIDYNKITKLPLYKLIEVIITNNSNNQFNVNDKIQLSAEHNGEQSYLQ